MNKTAASTFTGHIVKTSVNSFLKGLIGQILSTTFKHQGDLIGVTSVKHSEGILRELKLGNSNKGPGCSRVRKL